MNFAAILLGTVILAASSVSWGGEATYTKDIRQLVEARCLDCHGKDAAPEYDAFKKEKEKWLAQGQGMRLDTYSHLVFFTAWPDTGSLMRRLDDGKGTKDGEPGNMYRHLGDTEEERQKNLKLFKEWVGNWALKRWPEITKKELNGITVKY
jgi:hypothetical protein